MKIFYVHHANRKVKGKPTQSDSITSLGVQDAKNMAKVFAHIKNRRNIVAIYSSTFLRCQKTAEIINKKLKVELHLDPRLNEFKSAGDESWSDCQRRILSLLKEIVFAHADNESVLCVTSGVNLTAFIDAAYNLPPSDDKPFPLVATCSPIGLEISKKNFEKVDY